jgi:DNA invertase Pin-like site-specific DNA recombinase
MSAPKFIAYYRVSTGKQERSGLGLEAQQRDAAAFVRQRGGELLAEYQDVESGKHDDRPQLERAMRHCRVTGAELLIAKLDRLSRNSTFIGQLMQAGIVRFRAADMPDAGELETKVLALFAESERKAIGTRTKAALASAKARGVKLGNPQNLRNQQQGSIRGNQRKAVLADSKAADAVYFIRETQAEGITSLRGIAARLNERGIRTVRGSDWTATQVSRVLARIEQQSATAPADRTAT